MKTYSIEEQRRIDSVIRTCKICFVGMIDEQGDPYVLPMNFGYDGDAVYIHSASSGKSIRALEKNPKVCITFCTNPELVWQHPDVACSYRMKAESVICNGIALFESDFFEKEKALNLIMRQYTGRDFSYSIPAVNNVQVWKIAIESVAAKEFGVKPDKGRATVRP
ncbi:MAG: pyridoxamine 5'-phosphate oxidase family protein [Dysgonamonadaceae bacterium]|jgi:nitroimidazol reductase NimA-like FMN-containing flavoprotein (pyridoxamine 5'-phosphate oxidase superfamily)|nr:pyridoxamine 5'-phosphate oxidase family protein [Dysgonamonadaceae bacterium]